MIKLDPNEPTIQTLTTRGYRVSLHCYVKPNGAVTYNFAAKNHDSGRLLQGWSRGGSALDALHDLAKRAAVDGIVDLS